jgi:hypothetical protein
LLFDFTLQSDRACVDPERRAPELAQLVDVLIGVVLDRVDGRLLRQSAEPTSPGQPVPDPDPGIGRSRTQK